MVVALRADFLDISVDQLKVDDLTRVVEEGISTKQKWLVANHNLHSLYLFHREPHLYSEPKLRSYFKRAKYTHVDGMSIVLLARLYGHFFRRFYKVGYTDWLPHLMTAAVANGWRIFYLGSTPRVVEVGSARLRQRYRGLQIKGLDGYFDVADPAANEKVLASIAEYAPDLLMVGMGMPRQERWIEEHFDRIQAKVIVTSGAALDYVAGAIPTPPKWICRMGLEWACRLAAEPRRLAYRYLVEPWFVLTWVALDLAKIGQRRVLPRLSGKSKLAGPGGRGEGDYGAAG